MCLCGPRDKQLPWGGKLFGCGSPSHLTTSQATRYSFGRDVVFRLRFFVAVILLLGDLPLFLTFGTGHPPPGLLQSVLSTRPTTARSFLVASTDQTSRDSLFCGVSTTNMFPHRLAGSDGLFQSRFRPENLSFSSRVAGKLCPFLLHVPTLVGLSPAC